ncbi:MAG: Asp-tRNA(Asn)/Glu-tRNA(Gln) amidotransferase subunit GatC [Chloroflexi bacterium]|nr:Asp-tRNA(Asn)/Glu-tRNA(Gln) amidotransferase subunit GatC [Chloroflexota bacterium]
MKLDRDQVLHIAELAKLGLSAEEADRFTVQLSAILEYFELLDQLDTGAIPPTAMAIDQHNVLRKDSAGASLPVETVLQAPRTIGQFIAVKAVLD